MNANRFLSRYSIILGLLLDIGLTSCGGQTQSDTVTEISVITKDKSLQIGDSFTATEAIIVKGTNDFLRTVKWTSSDIKIATVSDDGVVKALKAGKAVIKACSKQNEAICGELVLTITETVPITPTVTSIIVTASDKNNLYDAQNFPQGLNLMLNAEVKGVGSYPTTVTWQSTDETVAKIVEDNKVTAVAPGKATIIACSTLTTSKTCGELNFNVITFKALEIVKVPEQVTLVIDDEFAIEPEMVKLGQGIKTISWSSTDTAVASVDEDGWFKASKEGETTIKACTLEQTPQICGQTKITVIPKTVTPPTISAIFLLPRFLSLTLDTTSGGRKVIDPVIFHRNAEKILVTSSLRQVGLLSGTWATSDPSVATIEEGTNEEGYKYGLITAKGIGVANITLCSSVDQAICGIVKVTVSKDYSD